MHIFNPATGANITLDGGSDGPVVGGSTGAPAREATAETPAAETPAAETPAAETPAEPAPPAGGAASDTPAGGATGGTGPA